MKNEYIVLDLETGGLKATENPITEIAAMRADPVTLPELDVFQSYVQNYGDEWVIEKAAIDATHVTMHDIKNGLPYKQACARLIEFLKSANPTGKKQNRPILVGHNIGFDIDFLIVLFYLCNKSFWDYVQPVPADTMTEMKEVEAGMLAKDESSRYTLSACAERLGIRLVNAHGAVNDIRATWEIKKTLLRFGRTAYKAMKEGGAVLDLSNTKQPANKTKKQRDDFFFEF